jgi:hypothetical protein
VSDESKSEPVEGRYANYFKVGYNAFEFLFDFGQCYQDNDIVQANIRIITAPVYAKGLLEMLKTSIAQYESMHGAISKDP